MSLQEDLVDLIGTLENNLTTMGVSDAEFDSTTGIVGLINKIRDVSPSVGGIDVVTNINCTLSSDNIISGDTIIISGVLEADKNDTSVTNVDLEGYLKGATINIYHNGVLIGTAITNQNGEYNYEYNNIDVIGTYDVYCTFSGTSNYEACESNKNSLIVSDAPSVFELTTTKEILSKHHNDTAILSVNYVTGASISIYNASDDSFIGNMIEGSNGVYTYTYSSTGGGDITVYAKAGNNSTDNTITLEDCYYYVGGEQSITRTSNWYGIFNTDKDITIETGIDYEITFQMKTSTTPSSNAEHRVFWTPSIYYYGGSQPTNAVFWGYATSYLQFGKRLTNASSSVTKSTTIGQWSDWKITKSKSNDRYYAYISGVYWDYYTVDTIGSYTSWKLHYILWSDTTLTLKDVKIKKTG